MLFKNKSNERMNLVPAIEILSKDLEASPEDYERALRTYYIFYPIQREIIFGSEVTRRLEGRTYLNNKKTLKEDV